MLCTQITYFLDVLYTESLTHNMFYTQKKHLILLCSKHRITYSCDVSIHRISSMRRSRSGCWPCPWIRKWSRCSPGTRGTVTKPLWLLQTPAFALNHVWSQVQVSLSIWETWNQFCLNFKVFFFSNRHLFIVVWFRFKVVWDTSILWHTVYRNKQ